MEKFMNVIKKNAYINKVVQSKKDVHSFGSLVTIPLTQSQNIMLGSCMEKLFADFVVSNGIQSIRKKTKKGDKETDHLYIHNKKIRYFEQKNNLNLDTEKGPATRKKVQAMMEQIKKEYPDYEIECYILATRYLSNEESIAKSIIRRKYSDVNVLGVNEFLKLFDIEPIEDYDMYKKIINEICVRKFKVATTSSS